VSVKTPGYKSMMPPLLAECLFSLVGRVGNAHPLDAYGIMEKSKEVESTYAGNPFKS
jgi:hypothetical protein